ncbi:MAG: flagellar hook-basal body complex protein [Tatlockia sp.]|nr:flagellar hook-basal body complex protein [Tatlockia sp.]
MTNCYYTSLSGMLAASFGLQNTSHNVANMQSPGFKRNDVLYSSLGDNKALGCGVKVSGIGTNFSAGNYVPTSSASDLAIVGEGFFIVRLKNGELVYTRDGEFGFNEEGQLTDKHSGGVVQGYNAKGDLTPIKQFGPQIRIGKATSIVDLAGQFVLKTKTPDVPSSNPNEKPTIEYENLKFTLPDIFDAKGKKHSIEIELQPVKPDVDQETQLGLTWKLIGLSYDGIPSDINTEQTIVFMTNSNGSLYEGQNYFDLHLPLNQSLRLNFGLYMNDQDKSVRLNLGQDKQIQAPSSLKIIKQDGYEEGNLVGFSFDEYGQISYSYDNKQTIEGIHIALAKFDDIEHTLVQTRDNLFRAKHNQGRHVGQANKKGFGTIKVNNLESANVDSTTEFANIVVLQRMFQACSQIMDIDKQLLEELFNK